MDVTGYSTLNSQLTAIQFYDPPYNVYAHHVIYLGEDILLPKKWHHLCLSYNGQSNTTNVVIVSEEHCMPKQITGKYSHAFMLQDGMALYNDSMESKIDAAVLKSLSASDCDGQQPTCETMSNVTVTDLNVWNMSLSMTTMINYTTCRLSQIST